MNLPGMDKAKFEWIDKKMVRNNLYRGTLKWYENRFVPRRIVATKYRNPEKGATRPTPQMTIQKWAWWEMKKAKKLPEYRAGRMRVT
jgi:hypothetical protein